MEAEEIKFKAQSADTIELVYGFYCELAGRKYIIPDYSQFRDIHDPDLENSFVEIIPETVGQFTGLKDKNGVEIYEGDIIRYYQPHSKTFHTHIVRWDDLFACFGLFKQDSKWCVESDWTKIQEIEVIGNIHDKNKQKQVLIDTMRGDEEIGLYDDNPKNQ